mgnify:CR=1 FL=1
MTSFAVRKGAIDDRAFRVIVLPNELQALLISDPKTQKAGAAMDVHVGHFADPDEISGLAHFTEHMSFLGTEKYPDEDSYSEFLSSHGGFSNAFTDMENTNYHFEVQFEHLREALDRFAQFFIAPLFTEDAVDREMNAVHNENAANLQSDFWRVFQLVKTTSNPKHPFSKFGTGNLDTLRDRPQKMGINTREEMMKFWEKHYSANNSKLVILGRESLDDLESMTVELFSPFVNKKVQLQDNVNRPFEEEHWGRFFRVMPVSCHRSLTLLWQLPSPQPTYRSKGHRYLSHLLGHEGKGSILALLKKLGLANTLSAGGAYHTHEFEMFLCEIDLTEEGSKQVHTVASIVFQYIRMLVQEGPQEWVFDELATVAKAEFEFREKTNAMNFVSSLASGLHVYPPEECLSGQVLFEEWDPDLISSFLNDMAPEKTVLIHMDNELNLEELTEVEPWYETRYSVRKFSGDELSAWSAEPVDPQLCLPSKNIFVAKDFSLKESSSSPHMKPVLLQEDNQLRLWHMLDTSYKIPRAGVKVILYSPFAYVTPRAQVYSLMLDNLTVDALNEFSYFAETAGLELRLGNSPVGFEIGVFGLNEKLLVLLDKILETLRDTVFSADRFSLIEEQCMRKYKNVMKSQPFEIAMYETDTVVKRKKFHVTEYIELEGDISLQELESIRQFYFQEMFAEAFVYGNVDHQDAHDVGELIRNRLRLKGLHPGSFPTREILQLTCGEEWKWMTQSTSEEDINCATEILFEIGVQNPQEDVLLLILCGLLEKPCFHQLRTVEQLGYIVFSSPKRLDGIQYLSIIVQSSDKEPEYIDERAEMMLLDFERNLEHETTEDQVQEFVRAAISARVDVDRKLGTEFARLWKEIDARQYVFDRDLREAENLKQVTKEAVLEFFRSYISKGAPKRRKLCVNVFGGKRSMPPADESTITNTHEFKNGKISYPLNLTY